MDQARIKAERDIGRADHLLGHLGDRLGDALAAIFGIGGKRAPAAVAELGIGFPEARRCADDAVFERAALDIADPVEREQDLLRDACRLLQDRVGQIGREFAQRLQPTEPVILVELVQHELHVAQRRFIDLHFFSPIRRPGGGRGRRRFPSTCSGPGGATHVSF